MHVARHLESGQGHFRCIHNDMPPQTHSYTLRGLFGAVIWIALWAVIITGFVGPDIRRSRATAEYWKGRHSWTTSASGGTLISLCAKCRMEPGPNTAATCPDRVVTSRLDD
jgi:hypothetical protein